MANMCDILEAAERKGNTEHLQEEIHDIFHAYYYSALDRFIGTVFLLAVALPFKRAQKVAKSLHSGLSH